MSTYPVAEILVQTVPFLGSEATLSLKSDRQGVRISLGEREVWIHVSGAGNLMVHLYHDQESEEIVTATITEEAIIVEGDYTTDEGE